MAEVEWKVETVLWWVALAVILFIIIYLFVTGRAFK